MDGVQGADDDGTGRQLVAARYDAVYFCGAAGLEGRVVQPLGFLDEFVEEGEAVGEFGCPFCVFVYASVDEFLN